MFSPTVPWVTRYTLGHPEPAISSRPPFQCLPPRPRQPRVPQRFQGLAHTMSVVQIFVIDLLNQCWISVSTITKPGADPEMFR